MKVVLLIVSTLTILLATESFVLPVVLEVNGVDVKEVPECPHNAFKLYEDLIDGKVNSRLTNIISEVIGMDISKFSEQLNTIKEKFRSVVLTQKERGDKILKNSNGITEKVDKIMSSAVEKMPGSSKTLISSAALKNVTNGFDRLYRKICNLRDSETVSKQEVVEIFEEFLGTKMTVTIRDLLLRQKMILRAILIWDEAYSSLREAVSEEEPELAKEINSFIDDTITMVVQIYRSVLTSYKSAIFSDNTLLENTNSTITSTKKLDVQLVNNNSMDD